MNVFESVQRLVWVVGSLDKLEDIGLKGVVFEVKDHDPIGLFNAALNVPAFAFGICKADNLGDDLLIFRLPYFGIFQLLVVLLYLLVAKIAVFALLGTLERLARALGADKIGVEHVLGIIGIAFAYQHDGKEGKTGKYASYVAFAAIIIFLFGCHGFGFVWFKYRG